MNAESLDKQKLVNMLGWLADAPLFIDHQQVERFYDAVVKPEGEAGITTIVFSSETTDQASTTTGGEVEVGVPALLGSVFAFLPKLTGKLEHTEGSEEKQAHSRSIELHAITNPQRQLEHLTLHYLASHRRRLWVGR